MSDKGVCSTAPATPGLLNTGNSRTCQEERGYWGGDGRRLGEYVCVTTAFIMPGTCGLGESMMEKRNNLSIHNVVQSDICLLIRILLKAAIND